MKKFLWKIPKNLEGERLDKALYQYMQRQFPLTRSFIRKLIISGAVYVNNRRVRIAAKPVFEGALVKIFLNEKKITQPTNQYTLQEKDILFEDEWLIFLNKPARLLSVPSIDEARDCLLNLVKNYLKKRENLPQVYLGVHHRLDAETSGVIVFSKKEEINKPLSEIFKEHLVQKTYYALCYKKNPHLSKTWEMRSEIVRAHPRKNIYRTAKEDEEGSFAYTQFQLLEENDKFALVQALPFTGRTHQIRVQLAHFGLPILGDKIYGTFPQSRLMLHAFSLSFRHPFTNQELSIVAPLSEEWKTICEKRGIFYFTNLTKS